MFLFDLIIFPFYVIVFYFFAKHQRKKMSNPLLAKYFIWGFWVRVISAFAFTFFQAFISGGDSIGVYYMEGIHVSKVILSDFSNVDKILFTASNNIDAQMFGISGGDIIFSDESNYMPARLAGILMIPGLRSYLITNLFFSLMAFAGCWKLFQFFYNQKPLLHKEIALAVLIFPTFIFWSSGISKEAICIASIGFLSHCFYTLFTKFKNVILNIVGILLSILFLKTVKSYILFSYAPFLIFFTFMSLKEKIQSKFIDVLLKFLIPVASIVFFIFVISTPGFINDIINAEELSGKFQTQQNNFLVQDATSNFSLGITLTGSLGNLIQAIPFALAATFLRPFIWEFNSITSFISAIECLFLAYLFFKYLTKKRSFKVSSIFKDKMVIFCWGFAILFGYFVGISTANFGSLVRYKIPCLPFFIIGLAILYHIKTEKSILK